MLNCKRQYIINHVSDKGICLLATSGVLQGEIQNWPHTGRREREDQRKRQITVGWQVADLIRRELSYKVSLG